MHCGARVSEFGAWLTSGRFEDPSLPELLESAKSLLADPSFSHVSEWKEAHGGRAIGCFPVFAPFELIHAAGMLPVSVYGAGSTIEIDHADSRMQSFVCSISRSTLELGLTGRLAPFDGFVFTSICDVARNLSGVFQRNFPNLMVEYLHMPQNTASGAVVDYGEAEFRRLLARLETLAGRKVSPSEIARSIALYNAGRRLMRDLYALRREAPWLVPTHELYLLNRAGGVLPKEMHIAMLRAALKSFKRREAKPRDSVKVVLEGSFCEQPPVELLKTLEEAGLAFLDDDFFLGHRWFQEDVPVDGNPVRALAESYLRTKVTSAVRWSGSKVDGLIRKVKESKADGVVFCAAKFCEPALYDYVPYKEALEKAKIPYLAIEFEEKMTAFENVRTQAETFVESVLFA